MEPRTRKVAFAAAGAVLVSALAVDRYVPVVRLSAVLFGFLAGVAVAGAAIVYLIFSVSVAHDRQKPQFLSARPKPAFSHPSQWDRERDRLIGRLQYQPARIVEAEPGLSAQIDDVVHAIVANFVQPWYGKISGAPTFTNEVDRALRAVIQGLVERLASQDVVDVVILKVVPLVTDHIHQFDLAERTVRGKQLNRQMTESDELDAAIAGRYSNGRIHSAVTLSSSLSRSSEQEYLRGLTTKLLSKLIPAAMRESGVVMALLREIVACAVLFPLIQTLADPDTWNVIFEQYGQKVLQDRKAVRQIRHALNEHSATDSRAKSCQMAALSFPKLSPHDSERRFERFVRAIGKCNSLSDARRFRSEVASQLHRDATVEGQDSLYIRRLETGKHMLDQKIAQFGMGTAKRQIKNRRKVQFPAAIMPAARSTLADQTQSNPGFPDSHLSADKHAAHKPFDRYSLRDVLNNASGLSSFMEFMDRSGRMSLVQFWLVVDGFRSPLEAGALGGEVAIDVSKTAWSDTDRTDLAQIKEAYLGRPEIDAHPDQIRTINLFLRSGRSATIDQYQLARKAIFAVQTAVQIEMEKEDFVAFQKSDLWFKLLASEGNFVQPHPIPSSLSVANRPQTRTPSGESRAESATNVSLIDQIQSAISAIAADVDVPPSSPSLHPTTKREKQAQASRSLSLVAIGLIPDTPPDLFSSHLFDEQIAAEENEDGTDQPSESEADDHASDGTIQSAHPGDLNLAETIDKLTLEIEKLVSQQSVLTPLINKAELTNNLPRLRILRKSKASLEKEIHHHEQQRQQYILQESDNGLFGRSAISIESVGMGREPDGREFALYVVQVEREAGEFMPAAVWAVPRRYSEFHALHKRLRMKYPAVAKLAFPRRQMMLKLHPQKDQLEKRRSGLEQYLQTVLTMPAVCRSHEFRLFLSRKTQTGRPSSAISNDPQPAPDLISRIYSSVTDGVGLFGHLPVLDQLSAASHNILSVATHRSNTVLDQEQPTSLSSVGEGTFTAILDPDTAAEAEAELQAFDSKEPSPLIEPICRGFLELFELNRESNWMRGRAVVVVLQQLLGGTIERKIRSVFRSALAPDSLANLIQSVRTKIWPPELDGMTKPPGPVRTDQQKRRSRSEAAALLAAVLPDTFGSVIGRANIAQASRRIAAMVNNRVLNAHLVFQVLDVLATALELD